LSALNLQKYAMNEFCSRHSKAIMALSSIYKVMEQRKSRYITCEQPPRKEVVRI
jgi:hypothetical protein